MVVETPVKTPARVWVQVPGLMSAASFTCRLREAAVTVLTSPRVQDTDGVPGPGVSLFRLSQVSGE